MNEILIPGYLRWDGTKYVLDSDVEVVGPAGPPGIGGPGPAGPAGAAGAQGLPGSAFSITATTQTTDGYAHVLTSIALPDGYVTGIDLVVVAKKTTTADAAKFNLSMSWVRHGGGVPQPLGTETSYDQRYTAGASTWIAHLVLNGNNAELQVTGQTSTTIDWEAQLQYVQVT